MRVLSASCALSSSSSLYVRPATVEGQKLLRGFHLASTMNSKTSPVVVRTLSSLQTQEACPRAPLKNRSFSSQPSQTQSGIGNTQAGRDVTKAGGDVFKDISGKVYKSTRWFSPKVNKIGKITIQVGGVFSALAAIVAYVYCEQHPEEELCDALRSKFGVKKK